MTITVPTVNYESNLDFLLDIDNLGLDQHFKTTSEPAAFIVVVPGKKSLTLLAKRDGGYDTIMSFFNWEGRSHSAYIASPYHEGHAIDHIKDNWPDIFEWLLFNPEWIYEINHSYKN